MALNKNVPFYLQIVHILRNEIISGKFLPGTPFPSDEEFAARFGVSKDVIRVSLRMLAEEGLIIRIRSKGTFLCDRPNPDNRRILLTVCQNPVAVDILRRGVELGIGKIKCDIIVKRVHPFDLQAERQCMASVKHNDLTAMVVTPAVALDDSDNRDLYAKYLKYGIPVIAVDHEFTDIPVDIVCFDEYGAMRDLAEEVLQSGINKTAFFIQKIPHRIVRYRDMALSEVAARLPSEKKRVFETSIKSLDNESIVDDYCQQLENSDFIPDSIMINNNMHAYKIFERFKNTEKFKSLKVIGCVGDANVGDEDFHSKLICHYRLYDDFVDPIREILSLRLENRMPIGMSMVRMIKFRRMTAAQINSYFVNALHNDYNKFN